MVDELPRTMAEFEEKFSNEAACLEFVRRLKWPNGFVCPKCAGTQSWKMKRPGYEQCSRCRHQTSVRAQTMFARSRRPLKLWFRVLADFLTDKRGASALCISRRHGLRYATVWTWLHKVRSTMDREGRQPLVKRVEADVMVPSLGGPDLPLGIGAVEKAEEGGCGRLRLGQLVQGDELPGFLARNLEKGTVVKMHAFPWANDTFRLESGLTPYTFRNAWLPAMNCVSHLVHRQMLGTYHGAAQGKHWKAYCDEFVFRFNRRTSENRWLLVGRALEGGIRRVPTYRELVGRRTEADRPGPPEEQGGSGGEEGGAPEEGGKGAQGDGEAVRDVPGAVLAAEAGGEDPSHGLEAAGEADVDEDGQ